MTLEKRTVAKFAAIGLTIGLIADYAIWLFVNIDVNIIALSAMWIVIFITILYMSLMWDGDYETEF